MAWLSTALRRSIVLILITAAGGAVWSWRRDAQDASAPGPAEWPPLPTPAPKPAPAEAANVVASGSAGVSADPLPDGSCPIAFPIKANANSGIFHVPGGRFYERTNAERCYSDADAAVADGYRRAKN